MARADELQQFLSEEGQKARRRIANIELAIGQILQLYENVREHYAARNWPYGFLLGEELPETPAGAPSSSTLAMILHAMSIVGEEPLARPLLGLSSAEPLDSYLSGWSEPKRKRLATDTARKIADELAERLKDGTLESETYGSKDIFTLTWLLEARRLRTKRLAGTALPPALTQTLTDAGNGLGPLADDPNIESGAPMSARQAKKYTDSSYTLLRVVQAAIAQREFTQNQPPQFLRDLHVKFRSRIYEQLSHHAIPDSRYDPAELAFCLEGAILTAAQNPAYVESGVLGRALDILKDGGPAGSSWRPTRPFISDEKRGTVLLPVSVEVANCLARVCDRVDLYLGNRAWTAALLPAFERYFDWLEARAVRGQLNGKQVIGWHSEHVNEPKRIHLWETSQVLLFLLHLRRLVAATIADRALALSSLSTEVPSGEVGKLKLDSNCDSLGDDFDAVKRIQQRFVEPRKPQGPASQAAAFSMLLYGPPGTGKTYTAKQLAAALGRRLVSVSVSDFLAGGPAAIEARAKDVFDVLQWQPHAVVLFDEVDHLLLDRETDLYTDLDTAFQFLTPGMLTKLQALRTGAQVVFIIATNYGDRIDPAIKRTGRIDEKILVLPPDRKARERILASELSARGHAQPPPVLSKLAAASVFLTHGDLDKAVKEYDFENGTITEFEEYLNRLAPTATHHSYSRLKNTESISDEALREFLGMLALKLEVVEEAAYSEEIARVTDVLSAFDPTSAFRVLDRWGDLGLGFVKQLRKSFA